MPPFDLIFSLAVGESTTKVQQDSEDGEDSLSYGLHFAYKNHPNHLILQDEYGYEMDLYTTNLEKALELRDTKTVIDY